MKEKVLLSIVTPTLGNFSEYWLDNLLKINGSVQFVLVYPPNIKIKAIDDPRVIAITSPYKGEMMQRFVGLLNTQGKYVLALDDDDFAHPQICQVVDTYFKKFPASWILRLQKLNINITDEQRIKQPWASIPDIEKLEVCRKTSENPYPYENGNYKGLLEVPIAPLQKQFDWRYLVFPFLTRKDNEGYHFENFNNIIWKNEILQQVLPEITKATKLIGTLTWIPNSGFDRLSGLFMQAFLFHQDVIIGHWMPKPEQIRYIDKNPALKPPRFHILSDFLLIKYFPQYGYFWNLFFSKLYGVPKTLGKAIKWKVKKHRI